MLDTESLSLDHLASVETHPDRPARSTLAMLTDGLKAEQAKKAFVEYPVNTIDGVRITFPHGWGLVRASNTQPVLVMRFEADTQARLEEYQHLVEGRIEELKKTL